MKFKRKQYLSKTSHRCSICGSQRRMFGENPKYKPLIKITKVEMKQLINQT